MPEEDPELEAAHRHSIQEVVGAIQLAGTPGLAEKDYRGVGPGEIEPVALAAIDIVEVFSCNPWTSFLMSSSSPWVCQRTPWRRTWVIKHHRQEKSQRHLESLLTRLTQRGKGGKVKHQRPQDCRREMCVR